VGSSKIEWTESTWNPVTGCSKVSSGCANCYAERMAKRLQAMGQENYVDGFNVTMHSRVLDIPLRWKKPQMIFVNSMSDVFHENVTIEFIGEIFQVMRKADWHIFQVLTKRSERLLEVAHEIDWPKNVWMGVSVESADTAFRINHLRKVPASIRFLSLEPLLGPIPDMDLNGIDWVIVGGESGPGARPMTKTWVRDIQKQCRSSKVRFFFKQWGGVNKKKAGRMLDGKLYDEMPQEFNYLLNNGNMARLPI
jgi:protein gp37